MRKRLRRVRKEDYNRVILTETSPYEVPIIFSNFGLYTLLKKIELEKVKHAASYLFFLKKKDAQSYTIPLQYKIKKDGVSFRNMSLLHPTSQVSFIDLYRDFDLQIINSCKKSNYTIRTPVKVANKYYISKYKQVQPEYSTNIVSSADEEMKTRFLTSYFSYSGYTRLYKFFDSDDFFSLEKKHELFCSLDISRCFDSIYTHSITWALKTKPFSKHHRNIQNTLGSVFDRFMQAANFNETAGIVIGPEVSRIFAEIIFHEIDRNIEVRLQELGLSHGKHYDIRRYVDDIFLFTSDQRTSEKIRLTIESCLSEYKLSINRAKTSTITRPFVTSKTTSLIKVKTSLNKLQDILLDQDNNGSIKIKPIHNKKKLFASFLNEIKSACTGDRSSYELACNFIIPSLTNLLIRVARAEIKSSQPQDTRLFFETLITIIFHFYIVSPSHSGSVQICKVIYTACEYFENHLLDEENTIKTLIYQLSNEFFESNRAPDPADQSTEFTLLEVLNTLCALKRLGDNFKLPEYTVKQNIQNKDKLTYFEIISVLYYIGDDPGYLSIRSLISKQIDFELHDLSDIRENTFKSYLLFDSLSCPYLAAAQRENLAKKFLTLTQSSAPSPTETKDFIEEISENSWFVSWRDANLLHLLEKKELLSGY